MRIFNQILRFIGGSVRRLVVLSAILFFFGGQMMGWWETPSLVNVNLTPPPELTSVLETAPAKIWSGGKRSAENATQHFEKHGAEFPYKTEAEYVKAAQDFVRHPPAGTQMTVQDDGDQVYYNPGLNYFAVSSPEGRIRTFFKPDPKIHGYKTNQDYFQAQMRKQ